MATRRAFAQEDTNLNTPSIKTSRVREYIDIDLSFTAKTTSGEIFKKTDAAAVKQAIKTLLLTNRLEKPFRPSFGGDIQGQLFELANRGSSTIIRRRIISTIQQFEPRAEIVDLVVDLRPDQNSLDVTLTFKIVNTNDEVEFTTTISRLR